MKVCRNGAFIRCLLTVMIASFGGAYLAIRRPLFGGGLRDGARANAFYRKFAILAETDVYTDLKKRSPYEECNIFGRDVFIKRADKIDFFGLSGNKAYKACHVAMLSPFPSRIMSAGGYQSNMMIALAKLVSHHPGSLFTYFTRKIPTRVRQQPVGNLHIALKAGMQIIEVDNKENFDVLCNAGELPSAMCSKYMRPNENEDLSQAYWIARGGAVSEAAIGIRLLARDLVEFASSRNNSAHDRPWKIIIDSGTGTTAVLLQRELGVLSPEGRIKVVAVPCVMDAEAMRKEMLAFSCQTLGGKHESNIICMPDILNSTLPRLRFGAPHSELLETWKSLRTFTGIEFDLLYAPSAWRQIIHDWKANPKYWEDCNIIYLHSGGSESNESQLRRYSFAQLDAYGME